MCDDGENDGGVSRFPINGHEAVVTDEAKRMLSRTKELCYLTSFVIRLFEDAEKVSKVFETARTRVSAFSLEFRFSFVQFFFPFA